MARPRPLRARPSPAFHPALRRVLHEQVIAERQARMVERRVLAFAGGAALGACRPRDVAASRRAAASFGLRGGELCGCHEVGCQTCAWSGGCGSQQCAQCAPWMKRMGWDLPAAKPAWKEDPSASARRGIRTMSTTDVIVDMHAHNFCEVPDDVRHYLAGHPGTVTQDRIDRLLSMRYDSSGVEQVTQSVLMGSFDAHSGRGTPGITDTVGINAVTARAFSDNSAYFLPFYHVAPHDHTDTTFLTDLESGLGTDWVGVGELYVHGHGEEIDASADLSAYPGLTGACELAAKYGVPVSVHWEIGLAGLVGDPDGDGVYRPSLDPAANFRQLLELLDRFPYVDDDGVSHGLKLILCHVGVGPAVVDEANGVYYDIWDFPGLFEAWKTRIRRLLNEYPNVYFDLAGMQVGMTSGAKLDAWRLYDPVSNDITQLGTFLLEQMAMFPERFLLGTDADNGTDTDTAARWCADTYSDSISMYLDFLDLGSLLDADKDLILWGNAETVLYGTV